MVTNIKSYKSSEKGSPGICIAKKRHSIHKKKWPAGASQNALLHSCQSVHFQDCEIFYGYLQLQ